MILKKKVINLETIQIMSNQSMSVFDNVEISTLKSFPSKFSNVSHLKFLVEQG